jgi:hypothetical protein
MACQLLGVALFVAGEPPPCVLNLPACLAALLWSWSSEGHALLILALALMPPLCLIPLLPHAGFAIAWYYFPSNDLTGGSTGTAHQILGTVIMGLAGAQVRHSAGATERGRPKG